MRAQHKGLIFSLSLKRFSPLDTEVVEIFAARTDCFTKKTLILFKGQKCSFVLKMDRSQGLNTNLGNKNAFQVIPPVSLKDQKTPEILLSGISTWPISQKSNYFCKFSSTALMQSLPLLSAVLSVATKSF